VIKIVFQSPKTASLIVQQHINAGLTNCVESYRSCQVWSSLIISSSSCTMQSYSHRSAFFWAL